MNFVKSLFKNIDISILLSALFLSGAGLSIIYSVDVNNTAFIKQLISLGIALVVFFVVSN
jgi:cell division protein FtsW (lipid II flippase)